MAARRVVPRSIAALLAVMLLPFAPAPEVGAAGGEPVLRLITTKSAVEGVRYGRRAPRVSPGLFLGVTQGTLDLRVSRSSFAEPVQLTQVITSPSGRTERVLPAELLDGWSGLDNFFRIKVTDADGNVAWSELKTFCPNSYERQRLGDRGPDVPTFPYWCYGSSRLLGMAYGVDADWAVSTTSESGLKLPVPDGTYTLDIAITSRYRQLFGIAPGASAVQLPLTVRTVEDTCRRCGHAHRPKSKQQQQVDPEEGVPTMLNPVDSVLPDLRALPSFNISASNRKNGRSFIDFAATVWVTGDSPVVVEGFRRQEAAVMDAYQYFYKDGVAVGRAPAGTFEYDLRDSHLHWHILQFVRYSLVDVDQSQPIVSAKESFCLVPTDAVDLSTDFAARTETAADLHTSCGGEEALWIRETLPLGWGDTYYQGGRYGFEITDVPNGTYFVEIAANPDGLLYEQDETNNVSLREIMLRGKPGARRVIVPDPYGIDEESHFHGDGGPGPRY